MIWNLFFVACAFIVVVVHSLVELEILVHVENDILGVFVENDLELV